MSETVENPMIKIPVAPDYREWSFSSRNIDEDEDNYGLCMCGCGQPAPIAKTNDNRRNWIKGQPIKFISGHNCKGKLNPNWKGGKITRADGYNSILKKDHLRANGAGYVMEHILIAEKVLGNPLPLEANIHHVNGNPADNHSCNLVICENNAYHKLLHRRKRALKACGHANWLKCSYCKQYDDPKNLYIKPNKNEGTHRNCQNEYRQKRLVNKRTIS